MSSIYLSRAQKNGYDVSPEKVRCATCGRKVYFIHYPNGWRCSRCLHFWRPVRRTNLNPVLVSNVTLPQRLLIYLMLFFVVLLFSVVAYGIMAIAAIYGVDTLITWLCVVPAAVLFAIFVLPKIKEFFTF